MGDSKNKMSLWNVNGLAAGPAPTMMVANDWGSLGGTQSAVHLIEDQRGNRHAL
jgi:hypothetical protein